VERTNERAESEGLADRASSEHMPNSTLSPSYGVIRRRWMVSGYAATVLMAIGIFLLIRNYGETLVAPPAAAGETAAKAVPHSTDALPHVLFALAAVIVAGQVIGRLFVYVGQPPVIGEVIAGILLGPSLLGPKTSALVLPPDVAPYLQVIAQLGVILYMFIVGLELNAEHLKGRAQALVATSHSSILLPFLLGSVLALALYPRLSSRDVPFTSFVLFLAVAMSVTAFPVLARILTDRGMTRTELGVIALSCAATDDVTAWCLLAFVVGIAKAQAGSGITVAVGALIYIAAMLLIVRPLAARLVARWPSERLPRSAAVLTFVALLASAITTDLIGIHAVLGAFLLGAVIPHDSALARSFIHQLEQIVTVLLLPAFFAFTGMRTRIDLVSGGEAWLLCGLIILVATVGKFGGTCVAARLTGLHWRDAAVLGALMNTRGLMELVVLNIGLDLKVISPALFAMMVLMAIVTTMMTGPALHFLLPATPHAETPPTVS
jgi:Kef-type K+ transport system membrane component KefB